MPMKKTRTGSNPLLFIPLLILTFTAKADHAPRTVLPDAVVDLGTAQGLARVHAQWRYSDTQIAAISHRDVGLDLKATGKSNRTFDFAAVMDACHSIGIASISPCRRRLLVSTQEAPPWFLRLLWTTTPKSG